ASVACAGRDLRHAAAARSADRDHQGDPGDAGERVPRAHRQGAAGLRRAWMAAALLAALGATTTWGADESPRGRPKPVLQRSHDLVVGPGEHKQKVRTLNDLLRDFLDTDAMGRAAMGKHLDGRSPAEVRSFLDVFRELFVRTYVQRLLLFDAPDFGFRGEK